MCFGVCEVNIFPFLSTQHFAFFIVLWLSLGSDLFAIGCSIGDPDQEYCHSTRKTAASLQAWSPSSSSHHNIAKEQTHTLHSANQKLMLMMQWGEAKLEINLFWCIHSDAVD